MVEQTLEFENAHFLLSLFAGDIGLSKEIESNFGVKSNYPVTLGSSSLGMRVQFQRLLLP